MDLLREWLLDLNISEEMVIYLSYVILILFIALLSFIAHIVTQKIVLRSFAHLIAKSKSVLGEKLVEWKVLHRLAHIVPAIIIYYFAPSFHDFQLAIEKMAYIYMIVVISAALNALLNALHDFYLTFEISKMRPIKGYVQVVKIALFILAGIVLVSTLIGQNPLILLSGLGALSAVLMLVFKDSILGLVAGIQLSANDMVRVGDWVEMPKYNADGDVIEISLNTVKVHNWDKTVTMVPSYAFISDSFKNWRGMRETGGRRIKRSIYIDVSSIKFCTDDMIEQFRKIHYLTDYIEEREREIEAYNRENNIDPTSKVNGRRMTNIGTYRKYIENYLANHPMIHKELISMVRQLAPGEHGLPLEIYCFTSDVRWVPYEAIQADIFDHILAVAPEFGLRVFQNPSGADMRNFITETSAVESAESSD